MPLPLAMSCSKARSGRELDEDADAVGQMLSRDVALGRLGTPQDVARLALWLASSAASFCTGGVFVADGGQVRS